MRFGLRLWRNSDPIASRLSRRLFDRAIIPNQFRTVYLKEMISPAFVRHGWAPAEDANENCDFGHSDGSRLKVMQAAARQSGSDDAMLQMRPVFQIRQLTGHGPNRPKSPPEIILIAWHAVVELDKADHREPAQWEFFLLPTRAIPKGQKTMGLPRVRQIAREQGGGMIAFGELSRAVEGMRLRLRAQIAVQDNQDVPETREFSGVVA